MKSEIVLDDIRRGASAARQIGAVGTPSFLLGESQPTGAKGEFFQGVVPLSVFESRMEKLLGALEDVENRPAQASQFALPDR